MNPTELGGDSAASEKSLRREGQVHCGCPAQRLSERLKAALIGAKVARALWVADGGPPSTGGTRAFCTVAGRFAWQRRPPRRPRAGASPQAAVEGRAARPRRRWRRVHRERASESLLAPQTLNPWLLPRPCNENIAREPAGASEPQTAPFRHPTPTPPPRRNRPRRATRPVPRGRSTYCASRCAPTAGRARRRRPTAPPSPPARKQVVKHASERGASTTLCCQPPPRDCVALERVANRTIYSDESTNRLDGSAS